MQCFSESNFLSTFVKYKCPNKINVIYRDNWIFTFLLLSYFFISVSRKNLGKWMMSSVTFQENYRMGGGFVWPKVSVVAEYRKKVRQSMLDVIENTPLELPVTQESKWVCLVWLMICRTILLAKKFRRSDGLYWTHVWTLFVSF